MHLHPPQRTVTRVWGITQALVGLVVFALATLSTNPPLYAAVMDVEGLVKAGGILEFRPFETKLYPYEPVTGNLVLRNGGGTPLEYKVDLLSGASVVMNVTLQDGKVVEVPFRNAPASRLRPPVIEVLEPGAERAHPLVFGTADSPLEVPGEYGVTFALTENGYLETQQIVIRVTAAGAADRSVLEAMMNLNPSLRNPVSLTDHLAANPGTAYVERIGEIVRSHPTSRYAGALAKEMAEYLTVAGGVDRDARREQYLRIAAAHGSVMVSHRARLDLARLVYSQGRRAEAREQLMSLEQSPEPRVNSAVKRLMDALGAPAPDAAEAFPTADLSPAATASLAQREESQILRVIREYFDALASNDAERLGIATGLSTRQAQVLLEELHGELAGKGIDSLVAANLPPVSPGGLLLQPIGTEAGLYSVRVENIELIVERGDIRETHTTDKVLHLRRGTSGAWVVVVLKNIEKNKASSLDGDPVLSKTIEMIEGESQERKESPALAVLHITKQTKKAIRKTLKKFYRAVVRQDSAKIQKSLAQGSTQASEFLQEMGAHEIVGIGPIPDLSFQPLPDGSVRTVVEEVPITVKEGDRKIRRTERHTFIMVREGRAWKILRVEK